MKKAKATVEKKSLIELVKDTAEAQKTNKLSSTEILEIKAYMYDAQAVEVELDRLRQIHNQRMDLLKGVAKKFIETRGLSFDTHSLNLATFEIVEKPKEE